MHSTQILKKKEGLFSRINKFFSESEEDSINTKHEENGFEYSGSYSTHDFNIEEYWDNYGLSDEEIKKRAEIKRQESIEHVTKKYKLNETPNNSVPPKSAGCQGECKYRFKDYLYWSTSGGTYESEYKVYECSACGNIRREFHRYL